MPDHLQLRYRWASANLFSVSEPELLYLKKWLAIVSCKRRCALDIGANWGPYTYSLSTLFSKVYAFEPNESTSVLIRNAKLQNVQLINMGASSESKSVELYIPSKDGVEYEGWGSVSAENLPGADSLRKKMINVRAIDEYKFDVVDFMKIDVEGHEYEVVRGGESLLNSFRPVVLIEVRESNIERISRFFYEKKYRKLRLKNLIGVDGSSQNYIFIPD